MTMHAREALVQFVGAGPGDPMLITLRGRTLIAQADVLIYADSLISDEMLTWARPDAAIYRSSGMTLEETTRVIVEAVHAGQHVVRLQSGDPSLYGAIAEQMVALDREDISYAVVPGVSSAFASAAALAVELTVPEVSQTVILTRLAGRTPVPCRESLRSLAAHGATMAVFLSIGQIEAVRDELLAGGYEPETPVAVVYRASWPDERIVRGTLQSIAQQVRQANLQSQALIVAGWALDPARGPERAGKYMLARSRLYDPTFSHGLRAANDPASGTRGSCPESQETAAWPAIEEDA
jgi:precorrin-4/cobalt-precorrin-4 C11-methyltransferase